MEAQWACLSPLWTKFVQAGSVGLLVKPDAGAERARLAFSVVHHCDGHHANCHLHGGTHGRARMSRARDPTTLGCDSGQLIEPAVGEMKQALDLVPPLMVPMAIGDEMSETSIRGAAERARGRQSKAAAACW